MHMETQRPQESQNYLSVMPEDSHLLFQQLLQNCNIQDWKHWKIDKQINPAELRAENKPSIYDQLVFEDNPKLSMRKNQSFQ